MIPTIDNLLHQLDRKSQQVEIEARVISASRAFSRDIGRTGLSGQAPPAQNQSFDGAPQVGVSPGPINSTASATTHLRSDNTSGGGPASGSFRWPPSWRGRSHERRRTSGQSANFALDFFITAAEAKGVGKLLSKPHMVTQNNEKATVKQGTKIPDADDRQQHDFGAVRRRRAAAGSHAADYRRRHDLHGRAGKTTRSINRIPRVQGIPGH